MSPLCQELPYCLPEQWFCRFADDPWSVLFHSPEQASSDYGTARYSYIAVDPYIRLELTSAGLLCNDVSVPCDDFFQWVKNAANAYHLPPLSDRPPFQGGVAGLLHYELIAHYESVLSEHHRQEVMPMASLGFYDLVHAFDHQQQKSWVFSSGLPRTLLHQRQSRARERLQSYLGRFQSSVPVRAENPSIAVKPSCFNQDSYRDAVDQAKAYIADGDIFEVNLSQRFAGVLSKDYSSWSLYQDLTQQNPSPFSAYAHYGAMRILSSSPERFIQIQQGNVETRPIKGTRKRDADPVVDHALSQDLVACEKERAENIMIVDLMRNDLSRVCQPDSISVPVLCGHEVYPHVHHLVSVVRGKLANGYNAFDCLKATFPGGSITGAPKIRAMQIISQLEPNLRGPYCGSLFWSSFDGQYMDSSILIRTIVIQGDEVFFHGGGAVTLASDSMEEYTETVDKVVPLKKALEH